MRGTPKTRAKIRLSVSERDSRVCAHIFELSLSAIANVTAKLTANPPPNGTGCSRQVSVLFVTDDSIYTAQLQWALFELHRAGR
jgi:hypothetical protein